MTYYYWYEDIRRRLTRCFRRLSWHIRLGILCHQERTAKLTNRTEITDESKHKDRRFKSVNLKYITPVPIELIVSLREWLVKSLTQVWQAVSSCSRRHYVSGWQLSFVSDREPGNVWIFFIIDSQFSFNEMVEIVCNEKVK
jgi:hypothetical protein